MDLDYVISHAKRFRGERGATKTCYFAPDEDAPYGRYWDGKAISENPSIDELNEYNLFWIAMANEEQKNVIQAHYDIQTANAFKTLTNGCSKRVIVEKAVRYWAQTYPQEYAEFSAHIEMMKATLMSANGMDRTKTMKLKGSIPHRVKQFVLFACPELVRYDGKSSTEFEKLFYEFYSKALIGGN